MKLWRDLEPDEEVKAGDRTTVVHHFNDDITWLVLDQEYVDFMGTNQSEYWIVQREVKLQWKTEGKSYRAEKCIELNQSWGGDWHYNINSRRYEDKLSFRWVIIVGH